ncbi:Splicing factor 3B subunit 3 [Bonamia ostreae]|uniref:Splicing factor 3B subunit 3 n=1 Tax=Bonamia ostreae TaxID=126728 RepID=A0ABV2AU03_9EUKA
MFEGDKFGNFIIHRLRGEEEDKLKTSLNIPYGGYLNSAGIKLIDSAHYYVGETITSLEKCVLNPGGAEVIIYSTIFGGIGVFYPLKNREDVDFFVHLETHMRQNAPPIAGRRHIDFRSSYFPVKNCVDGDLCEQFGSMSRDVQKHITSEMVMKDPNTIKKRIEILRSHII